MKLQKDMAAQMDKAARDEAGVYNLTVAFAKKTYGLVSEDDAARLALAIQKIGVKAAIIRLGG